jgi:hypothetical protein
MPESKATLNEERIIVASAASSLSPAVVQKYHGKSKEVNASYIGTTIMSLAFCVSHLSFWP